MKNATNFFIIFCPFSVKRYGNSGVHIIPLLKCSGGFFSWPNLGQEPGFCQPKYHRPITRDFWQKHAGKCKYTDKNKNRLFDESPPLQYELIT
jgi:hypothetical protein